VVSAKLAVDRAAGWTDHRPEETAMAGRGYDSSINRLVMIAFILAFIAGLLAIMY
jgi:hypothetical protein